VKQFTSGTVASWKALAGIGVGGERHDRIESGARSLDLGQAFGILHSTRTRLGYTIIIIIILIIILIIIINIVVVTIFYPQTTSDKQYVIRRNSDNNN